LLFEEKNSRNQGFSYYFCLMTEGSVPIPLISGSGPGRHKNMCIWLGTTILQWYYLVELGLDGHLLVAGGAGKVVDAPGLV
jgi:hypothetical protein